MKTPTHARKLLVGGITVVVLGSALAAVLTLAAADEHATAGTQAGAPADGLPEAVRAEIDRLPRSPFQADLLEDGQLTEDEYDRAFTAYTGCVREAGGEILGPGSKNARGEYQFAVGVPPSSPGVANTEAIFGVEACSREYWDVVGQRWSAAHMVAPADAAVVFAKIPACMREGGIEPPSDLSPGWSLRFAHSAARAEQAVLGACLRKANEELGLYGYGMAP